MNEDQIYMVLDIDFSKTEVISFVGGGGKTTIIEELSKQLKGLGKKVLWTTSTAIYRPENQIVFIGDIPIDYIPEKSSITVFGQYEENGKLRLNDLSELEGIIKRNIFDCILIESDGSKGKPIKAPDIHEPVISNLSTTTIGLIGANCLNKHIDETVHRPIIFKKTIGVESNHIIDYKDILKLVLHKEGLFKNSIGRKILILNKVSEEEVLAAYRINEGLSNTDIKVVLRMKKQIEPTPRLVCIRGGGDVATGIAHRLHKAGFYVVILEIEEPLSIRRKVSFSDAIYTGEIIVEGIKSVYIKNIEDVIFTLKKGNIPVLIDEYGNTIRALKPIAVVDSILAKKSLGTTMDLAPITVGVGPGFVAGVDVDLVIESMRGHNLGRVLSSGKAMDNTGIPASVMGYTEERVLRATSTGRISNIHNIGDVVTKGTPVCSIGDDYIIANISGVIRGLIKDGLWVSKGLKIGDIDPRGIKEYAYSISDKARAIGGGVLEAIMYLLKEVELNE